ncbi:hypothetical protein SAMN05421743_103232 [Thalassobacillus cyri]|uniref:Lipoprotein n=1 Tax=Thalassobacillus cyri TaxID=571932 RepID=A0A1H3ZFW9_9BACI|nr:hypothetical protein [Thalassobacillus cyri]SEA22600.1 hypothetical protein SAMN05421743_103232 [Thalassobacillus cyri]
MKRLVCLLSVFIFIAGCQNKESEMTTMTDMLDKEEPVAFLEMNSNDFHYSMDEQAKTTEEDKIQKFKNMINGFELQAVKKEENSEVYKGLNKLRNEGKSLITFLRPGKNSEDSLMLELTADGSGLFVNFDKGNAGPLYKVVNGSSEIYEKLHSYYLSINKEVPLQENEGKEREG